MTRYEKITGESIERLTMEKVRSLHLRGYVHSVEARDCCAEHSKLGLCPQYNSCVECFLAYLKEEVGEE